MYAVIKTGGKQYRVNEQDVLQIEKIAAQEGDSVTFDNVLMVGSDSEVFLGTPTVEGASVVAEVLEQTRARKIIVFKKRRRKNSRSKNGHRQRLTTIRIDEILAGGGQPIKVSEKPEEDKKAADSQPNEVENEKVESPESTEKPNQVADSPQTEPKVEEQAAESANAEANVETAAEVDAAAGETDSDAAEVKDQEVDSNPDTDAKSSDDSDSNETETDSDASESEVDSADDSESTKA